MKSLLAAAALLALGGCAYFGDDDGSGSGSGSGSNPGGSGNTCGGFVGQMCAGSEYCDLEDPRCAIPDGAGTCRARPTVCPDLYAPVTGSDGMVYGNACEAHAAGADDCGPA